MPRKTDTQAIPKHYSKVSVQGISSLPEVQALHPLGRFLWAMHMRSVLRKGLTCTITPARFMELSESPCHYCGQPPYERVYSGKLTGHANGLDRLDNSLGYVEGNIVPACKDCNGMKSSRDTGDWLRAVLRIARAAGWTPPPGWDEPID